MTAKHLSEYSIKNTIPLAGIPGEKIEYTNPQKGYSMSKEEHKSKKDAEKSTRLAQGSFTFESMTAEDIAEMNSFLDEKYEGFNKDSLDEISDILAKRVATKRQYNMNSAEDQLRSNRVKAYDKEVKDMVNSTNKKFDRNQKLNIARDYRKDKDTDDYTDISMRKGEMGESVVESFIIGELSFVQASPITSSLAESIAMVMNVSGISESKEDARSAAQYHRQMVDYHDDKLDSETNPQKISIHAHASNMHNLAMKSNLEAAWARNADHGEHSAHKSQSRMADAASKLAT